MDTQLFVKVIENDVNPIINPSFTEGLDISGGPEGWIARDPIVCRYGAVYNNLTNTSRDNTLNQTNLLNGPGLYKLSFKVLKPLDGSAIKGLINCTISSNIHAAFTPLAQNYSFVFTVTSGDGIWLEWVRIGSVPCNVGFTNVKLEKIDGKYKELDLYEDVEIPLTYNQTDIEDFTTKTGNYSISLNLPATKNNNDYFKNIGISNVTDAYIFMEPVDCYVVSKGYTTFKGCLQLMSSNRSVEQFTHYECNLYSTLATLASAIGKKYLTVNDNKIDDLDFSEYDQKLTVSNVYDATNNYVPGTGMVYVPIDKMDRYDATNASAANYWEVCEFSPSLFVKDIWDRIFEDAGFTYQSTFIDGTNPKYGDYFKHLIYPYSDPLLLIPQSIIDANTVYAIDGGEFESSTVVNENTPPSSGYTDLVYNQKRNRFTEVTDGSNDCYDQTTGIFTCKEKGYYNVKANFVGHLQMTWTADPDHPSDTKLCSGIDILGTIHYAFVNCNVTLYKENSTHTIFTPIQGQNYGLDFVDQPLLPGSTYERYVDGVWDAGRSLYIKDIGPDNGKVEFKSDYPIYLEEGECLLVNLTTSIGYRASYPPTWFYLFVYDVVYYKPTVSIELTGHINQSDTFFSVSLDKKIVSGMKFYANTILHKDSQLDFVVSIMKMFDLYMDQIDETTILIEPRTDYYKASNVVKDWTIKMARDAENKLERASDLITKWIDFKYRDDSDKWNEDYKNAYYINFGEFSQKEKLNIDESNIYGIELLFSPTLSGKIQPNLSGECPKIYSMDSTGKVVDTSKNYNSRILYYDGKYSTKNSDENFVIVDSGSKLINWTPGQENYTYWHIGVTYYIGYIVYCKAAPYDPLSPYVANISIVTYLGITYICILDNTGYYPPNGTYWTVINYIQTGFVGVYSCITAHISTTDSPTVDIVDWERIANYSDNKGVSIYSGMLNGIYGTETRDLAWAQPFDWWTSKYATANGLYNYFWAAHIDELLSDDSRMLTAYFYLTPDDISDFKFSDRIVVDGVYYKVLLIEEFVMGKLTKVTLLKSLHPFFSPDIEFWWSVIPWNGGNGNNGGGTGNMQSILVTHGRFSPVVGKIDASLTSTSEIITDPRDPITENPFMNVDVIDGGNIMDATIPRPRQLGSQIVIDGNAMDLDNGTDTSSFVDCGLSFI